MGKTNSIITNGSTNNGNQEDDEDNNNQENEKDKNLAWIEKLLDWDKNKGSDKVYGTYLDNSIKTRKDLNFTTDEGLIDSGSGSPFVKNIEGTLNTNEIISGCSWAFAGYTDKDGQKYYNVSIYNPAKNDGKSLADVKPGTEIKTDIYKVNANTGEVTKITDYKNQQIAAVRKDKNYIVIRDSGYNQ